jgi:hypothetical protein
MMSLITIASNGVLTLLFFGLTVGYPGIRMMLYSWGMGGLLDTDAARNDAFDLAMSMGAALGIPQITLVDHFNIASACMFPLCWLPVETYPRVQTLVGGAALLSGMYMFLFVAVFAPSVGGVTQVLDALVISHDGYRTGSVLAPSQSTLSDTATMGNGGWDIGAIGPLGFLPAGAPIDVDL